MHEVMDTKTAGLGKLTIDRSQRPTRSGGGRLVLLILALIVCAALAATAWWYYRTTGSAIAASLSPQTIDVTLLRIERPRTDTGPVVLVATGKIVSDRKVNVATKVSGQIVEMNVEQGDHVEQGQVLARIEEIAYRAARDESAANVERFRHEIARAESDHARALAAVAQAQADLDLARRDYERLSRLYNAQQASEKEYLDAKDKYQRAEAALKVARAAVGVAAAAVDSAKAQVAASEAALRLVQKRLDDCAIRAPISGVILERNAQVGDFLAAEGGRGANANAQLVAIADMTRLRVEIDISERDIGRIHRGQPARITPDANRQHAYDGHVMWIDPKGDYAKATVQVKVRIHDPGPDLRIDGSAKVEFLGGGAADSTAPGRSPASQPGAQTSPATASDHQGAAATGSQSSAALWLPKSAVKMPAGSGTGTVFTVRDDHAQAHTVKIGVRGDKQVQILGGIEPGWEIIRDGLDKIEDGTPVRVVRRTTAAES